MGSLLYTWGGGGSSNIKTTGLLSYSALSECFVVVGRVTEVASSEGLRCILLFNMICELQCEVDSKYV